MSETRDEAAAALVEDLQSLGTLRSKAMFGGVGIFDDDMMFAMVDREGATLLRGADGEVDDWVAAGAEKHGRMPYWTIPDAVRADPDETLAWGRRAHAIATAAR